MLSWSFPIFRKYPETSSPMGCQRQLGPEQWLTTKARRQHACFPTFKGVTGGKMRLQRGGPSFNPWVGKISWRRKWQLTLVFMPGKSHEPRSLVGYSLWGRKELDMTERLHFLSLVFWTSKSLWVVDCSHEIKKTLAPWKKIYDKPRQHIKEQRYHFAD